MPGRHLTLDRVVDGRRENGVEGGSVDRFASLGREQHLGHRCRPRQRADVGGLDIGIDSTPRRTAR